MPCGWPKDTGRRPETWWCSQSLRLSRRDVDEIGEPDALPHVVRASARDCFVDRLRDGFLDRDLGRLALHLDRERDLEELAHVRTLLTHRAVASASVHASSIDSRIPAATRSHVAAADRADRADRAASPAARAAPPPASAAAVAFSPPAATHPTAHAACAVDSSVADPAVARAAFAA